MKKLVIAAVVVLSTVAFTSCTKENVAPTHKANTLASGDKGNLSQADFSGDLGNLSQADLNGSGNGTGGN